VAVGIVIGGSVILQRGQIPHDSPDERVTLNAVEVDRPPDAAPMDEPDARGARLPPKARPREFGQDLLVAVSMRTVNEQAPRR
jgi:hypothetical protein